MILTYKHKTLLHYSLASANRSGLQPEISHLRQRTVTAEQQTSRHTAVARTWGEANSCFHLSQCYFYFLPRCPRQQHYFHRFAPSAFKQSTSHQAQAPRQVRRPPTGGRDRRTCNVVVLDSASYVIMSINLISNRIDWIIVLMYLTILHSIIILKITWSHNLLTAHHDIRI